VTHPKIFRPPSDIESALGAVHDLVSTPGVVTLSESADHASILGDLVSRGGVVGAKIHDARIAAECLGHGVDELWSADRDFSYFPALATRNPLVR
jgi:uncharacterized protein